MARIINLDALDMRPLRELAPGAPPAFDARIGQIAQSLGAQKLGYNLTVVPPGKRAWPHHNHRNNEEMFLVLAGRGELRLGDAVHPVREGDVIACPPGGPETAHQLVNTGDVELRYLCVGTVLSPDVVQYPDSGKFGVRVDPAPGDDATTPAFRIRGRSGPNLDYWDGE